MSWYAIQQRLNAVTEINIFGEIGFDVDGTEIIKTIRSAGNQRRVDVIINSEGGSALVGLAISNAIRSSEVPVHCEVVGFALSAAANIAIACDRVTMLDGAFLMFHHANAFAAGGIQDLQQTIELMKKFDNESISRVVTRTGESRETVEQWFANERWFSSSEALAAKLIDEVKPQTAKLAAHVDLSKLGYTNVPAQLREIFSMATPNEQPATVEQIRAACPGADDSFVVNQIEHKHTLSQVQTAWSAVQAQEIRMLRTQKAGDLGGVDPLRSCGSGPVGAGSEYDGDAENIFDAKVRELMGRGMSRANAVCAVAKKHPDLHKAYLLQTNAGRGVDHMIEDRFARAKHGRR